MNLRLVQGMAFRPGQCSNPRGCHWEGDRPQTTQCHCHPPFVDSDKNRSSLLRDEHLWNCSYNAIRVLCCLQEFSHLQTWWIIRHLHCYNRWRQTYQSSGCKCNRVQSAVLPWCNRGVVHGAHQGSFPSDVLRAGQQCLGEQRQHGTQVCTRPGSLHVWQQQRKSCELAMWSAGAMLHTLPPSRTLSATRRAATPSAFRASLACACSKSEAAEIKRYLEWVT